MCCYTTAATTQNTGWMRWNNTTGCCYGHNTLAGYYNVPQSRHRKRNRREYGCGASADNAACIGAYFFLVSVDNVLQ